MQLPVNVTLSKLNVPDEPEAEYAKILNLAFGSSLSAVTALKPKDIVCKFESFCNVLDELNKLKVVPSVE
jgi:hypothetical protein